MTKQIIFILALLPTLLFGQSKKLELGLMVGNNGQLDNTLNDFYTVDYYSRVAPNKLDAKIANIKYTASARYFFTDNFSARIKFGRSIRRDFLTQTSPIGYWDFDIHQTLTNISPSVCFSKRIDKFEILTGIEIPFIQVGNFTQKSNYKYWPDSVTKTIDENYTRTKTGGFIWGINNFIGVKYYFKNWLSLGAEINYGVLFANLGGKYKWEYVNNLNPQNHLSYELETKYKRTFFSTPEVSFGLFIQLGRKKTKA